MKKQVDDSHYTFSSYVSKGRWSSYYNQIEEALSIKGNNILVIGIGDGIVVDVLKKYKSVTTFDFEKDLHPDILGSVEDFSKLVTKDYDCIVCCQVLEHLPFEKFENIVNNIISHTKEKFILSLPNRNLSINFRIYIPIIKQLKLNIPIRRFWDKKFEISKQGFNEHYWEVNAKGYSNTRIKKILKKSCVINKVFTDLEITSHIFYILFPIEGENNE